jgi:hypothetical protein
MLRCVGCLPWDGFMRDRIQVPCLGVLLLTVPTCLSIACRGVVPGVERCGCRPCLPGCRIKVD